MTELDYPKSSAPLDADLSQMTSEAYYAEVRRLGLTPSGTVRTVYFDRDHEPRHVPEPGKYNVAQRRAILIRLAKLLAVDSEAG